MTSYYKCSTCNECATNAWINVNWAVNFVQNVICWD